MCWFKVVSALDKNVKYFTRLFRLRLLGRILYIFACTIYQAWCCLYWRKKGDKFQIYSKWFGKEEKKGMGFLFSFPFSFPSLVTSKNQTCQINLKFVPIFVANKDSILAEAMDLWKKAAYTNNKMNSKKSQNLYVFGGQHIVELRTSTSASQILLNPNTWEKNDS